MRTLLSSCVILAAQLLYGQVTQDSVRHDSVTTANLHAQTSTSPVTNRKDMRPFKERISLGGSTGFWWSINQVHVEVSPILAYHFPKILTTGVGYRYIYVHDIINNKNLNNYGPNLFARAQLTKRIYLWSEWENLRTEYVVKSGLLQEASVQHEYVDSFFAGFGYVRHFGKRGRAGLGFQLLYNFLYNRENNSPYYSPVIYRIGYFF